MKEEKLISLLSNLDDDLVDKEIDKLFEGVEIDMNSINEKTRQKLNNGKKLRRIKKLPLVVAACICLLSISIVVADNISTAVKAFFGKTPVYATVVDGDAYYLKDKLVLNKHFTMENVMVSKGNLDMTTSTDLDIESQLADVQVIPYSDTNSVYCPGGYSIEDGKYRFIFMNKEKKNYDIAPFKDFKFIITGKTFDVSLEEAKSIDENNKVYTPETNAKDIKGVNIGAQIVEGKERLNVMLLAAFEDKDMKLVALGKPIYENVSSLYEKQGDIETASSTPNKTEDLYVYDQAGKQYKLEIPKDAKGLPVTIFETDAPKDKALSVKLPSIITTYDKLIDDLTLNIPKAGEVAIDKEIDFNYQKAIIKSIKRVSPTTAVVEMQLNTKHESDMSLRYFDIYSTSVKKISTEFNNNTAIMTLELNENLETVDIKISQPDFVINGDWTIDIK